MKKIISLFLATLFCFAVLSGCGDTQKKEPDETLIVPQEKIYTEYEGKKQVNILVSEAIGKLYKLIDSDLSERFSVTDTMISSVNVSRSEGGFYIANIVVKIEI